MVSEHVQLRTGKRRQTEARIISAAAELFLERGYKATTIRAIATAAEVSVGRVMATGDKDSILVACFDRWIGQLQNGTYTPPPPRRASLSRAGGQASGRSADSGTAEAAGAASIGVTMTAASPRPASAVQRHLLDHFLPFLEFFAAHEDLSRDYTAAMIRVKEDPEVFHTLAEDLQGRLSDSLTSIGISEDHARSSAVALYDSYLGILFRWAATSMTLPEATDALLSVIAFHTRVRSAL
ncbi:TetR/AcrR family transcriptional regulator [Brevibacterium atlanticum]|uniref:TetR/AcrR family transcriptional regulator n=1 Tax=Brevibacterium atlanticum TaxID=2697563 RepID=UPI00141F2AE4|nr:TetR/AcrR family transcriptional regulator [Brevibacterium atlanticum]